MFTLLHHEKYSDKPAPIFATRKEAERVATALRTMRAWVEVIKIEKSEEN